MHWARTNSSIGHGTSAERRRLRWNVSVIEVGLFRRLEHTLGALRRKFERVRCCRASDITIGVVEQGRQCGASRLTSSSQFSIKMFLNRHSCSKGLDHPAPRPALPRPLRQQFAGPVLPMIGVELQSLYGFDPLVRMAWWSFSSIEAGNRGV
jgi:hypothetical protein